MLIVGDTHGRLGWIQYIDNYAKQFGISTIIQVGDFGICWPGETDVFDYFLSTDGPTWYSCLGNHDNYTYFDKYVDQILPGLCMYSPRCWGVKRGFYLPLEGGVVFCGGAVSTDAEARKEGISFWSQECPTQDEYQIFIDSIELNKPRVVITHDGPIFAHQGRGRGINPQSGLHYNHSSIQLANIDKLLTHRPEYWFFGHHHELTKYTDRRCTYACCGLHGEGYLLDGELSDIG